MQSRCFPLAVTLLAMMAPRAALAADNQAAKPSKPTVIVRIAPINNLIADARYLAEIAGKSEESKQAEAILKSMTDAKGLLGIDVTKPIGLYGYLGPGGGDSQAVLLLPVADEKAFIEKIGNFDLKPEKAQDGVWKLDVDRIPFPIYFKFANNYVYATVRDQEAIKKDRLLDPAKVLAGSGALSAVVNLDEIPNNLKEIALSQSELRMAEAKDREMPNETKAQRTFRQAALDETFAWLKQLLNEGGSLSARVELDRTAGNLTASASLTGKPDSKLERHIAGLDKLTSIAASIVRREAALTAHLDAALPVKLREALAPVIEEAFQQAIEKEKDEAKRKLAQPILKVLAPTAKMGELDAGFSLIGPEADGLYTVLAAAKIKDGKALESTLKEALKDSPAKEKGALAIDFAKAGDVNIHKAVPDKVDDETRKRFGDNPIYFAFRDDAMIVTAGPGALDTIKSAVAAVPSTSPILQLDASLSRLVKLVALEHKNAPDVAKKVFKGGDDTVRLTLEGGSALKLSLTLKTQLVRYFVELAEGHKE